MAPKPQAMLAVPADGEHVFYWPDTGPVEVVTKGGEIVEAQTVEPLVAVIDGKESASLPWAWMKS